MQGLTAISRKTLILDLSAIHAVDFLIQPLRQLTNTQSRILAAELILPAVGRTAMVHVKLTRITLLDHHAADLAVEVAEDVVEVGAPRVARNPSTFALEVGRGEDGGAAAVVGRSGESLCHG
jgi:hypothetical protein